MNFIPIKITICFKMFTSFDDVEGIDLLRWEDQEKIRKYVEGGSINTSSTVDSECAIEVSQTSRATCRRCNEKIMKGTVSILSNSSVKFLDIFFQFVC